jgi:hypothetical protein
MGLEPTTFCMAAGKRSRPFARVRRTRIFAAAFHSASERQRTRANGECSLAAIVILATFRLIVSYACPRVPMRHAQTPVGARAESQVFVYVSG